MADPTESTRRSMVRELNSDPQGRESLEARYGDVWDTQELQKHFSVLAFSAPFCIVSRESDGVRGSVLFQHNPRFYHSFTPEG